MGVIGVLYKPHLNAPATWSAVVMTEDEGEVLMCTTYFKNRNGLEHCRGSHGYTAVAGVMASGGWNVEPSQVVQFPLSYWLCRSHSQTLATCIDQPGLEPISGSHHQLAVPMEAAWFVAAVARLGRTWQGLSSN